MRTLLALFVVVGSGCGPSDLSASWDKAEVISSDRAIAIHPLWPTTRVRATITNRTDSSATFFLGGWTDGNGFFLGAEPEATGRFLLVGPDTTLPMVARPWGERIGHSPFGRATVAPGADLQLALWSDSRWLFPTPDRTKPSFIPIDSTASADFYGRALESGQIIYVESHRDTLAIAPLLAAEVYYRAEDQPSVFD